MYLRHKGVNVQEYGPEHPQFVTSNRT